MVTSTVRTVARTVSRFCLLAKHRCARPKSRKPAAGQVFLSFVTPPGILLSQKFLSPQRHRNFLLRRRPASLGPMALGLASIPSMEPCEYQKAADMLRTFGIHDPTGNRTRINGLKSRRPNR